MSQELAEKQFKDTYSRSFEKVTRNMAGRIPYTLVAISRPETLQQLVKITMQSIHVNRNSSPSNMPFLRRLLDRPTQRNQPTRLDEDLPDSAEIALATAQRVDMEEKINASIRVGKQKYWRAIASSVFIGVNFQNCLNVIHKDIVAIWNIRGLSQYLLSDKFRDLMMVIVDDLHSQSASASTNVKWKGSPAKRLMNIYEGLPENIRCLMGYVVDFTLVIQAVFQVSLDDQYEGKVKVDRVKEIVYEYYCSETKEKIHNAIRTFVKHPFAQNSVADRIESLIGQNRMTKDDTEFNRDRPTLPSLLTILGIEHAVLGELKEISPISIILLCKLLDSQDYNGIASTLDNPTDADLLLDFMLHAVRNGFLLDTGVLNANRKARNLMYKLIKQAGVLPRSLFILNIRKLDSIGAGGFGQVYKGEYKGSDVALKVLYRYSHEDDLLRKDFCRETLFWRSLSHTYILPLLGIYEEKPHMYLVSPYMKSGTLTEWRKKTQFSATEIRQRMLEIAEGVRYIHSEGIVHGDLRGDNILVGSGPCCQIADFGLTRHVDATVTRSQSEMSINFAAPELFGACNLCGMADCECREDGDECRRKKTMATDIYAFGCLYYAIYFDRVPFLHKNDFQITKLVTTGQHPDRPTEPRMENDMWNLIHDCWATNPSERPKMKDIVARMKSLSS
ncbi:hypothetical protein APHAL10511_004640 [Amanita phalloides]|nr:hypothetical protein APHAL10511_004640 [Amanita phalloides]